MRRIIKTTNTFEDEDGLKTTITQQAKPKKSESDNQNNDNLNLKQQQIIDSLNLGMFDSEMSEIDPNWGNNPDFQEQQSFFDAADAMKDYQDMMDENIPIAENTTVLDSPFEEDQDRLPLNFSNASEIKEDSGVFNMHPEDIHPMEFKRLADEKEEQDWANRSLGDIHPMQFSKAASDKENTPKSTKDATDIIDTDAPEVKPIINQFLVDLKKLNAEEAEYAASEIMQNLKETGFDKVKPRAFKAIALTLAAMMFGADATDAFNQGFGVVADDYATEAGVAADALKRQQDWEDFQREEAFKHGLTAPAKNATARQEINKYNNTWADSIVDDLAKDVKTLNFMKRTELKSAIMRAINEHNAVYKDDIVDLTNPSHQILFTEGINNYVAHTVANNGDSQGLSLHSFIKDLKIRAELPQYKGVLNNSHFTRGDEYSKNLKEKDRMKATNEAHEVIKSLSGILDNGVPMGMDSAIKLVNMDFLAWKETPMYKNSHKKNAEKAGLSDFLYFLTINGVYTPNNENLGSAFSKK